MKFAGQLQGGGEWLLGGEMGRNQISLPTQPLVRTPQTETLGPERPFLLLHKTTKILISHSRNTCVCPRYVKGRLWGCEVEGTESCPQGASCTVWGGCRSCSLCLGLQKACLSFHGGVSAVFDSRSVPQLLPALISHPQIPGRRDHS